MKPCSHLALLLTLGLAAANAAAQDSRPLREAASPNERFCLRIRPGQPGGDALRGCKATLYERAAEERRGRPRWARFLVNDVAPAQAFIRDDGRFVITLDEYRVGGARHALAIYNERGQLLRHFLLPDLLRAEDWKHVRVEKRSIEWLGGAKCEFVEKPDEFLITLKHGRQIRIDLASLQVVPPDAPQALVEGVPLEFLALLFGEEYAQTAAESAPRPAAPPDERVVAEDIPEEVAAQTIEDAAVAEVPVEARPQEPPVSEARPKPSAPSDQPPPETADLAHETAADLPADEYAEAPGGIVVPAPDPADPVDYVAWTNEMTRTTGSDAAADYQAAIDLLTPWEGDGALLRAAARGEPQALVAPEVQQWLEANRAALAYFRSGTELDCYNRQLHSEDGSMIGVLLPGLSSMRQLGRAALIVGRQSAAAGEPWEAADNYLDALAAGSHAGNGPTLIENLVGIAMQAAATDALLDLQADPQAVDLDYAELAACLQEAARPPRPLTEALQFERAMFMDTVQRMFEHDPETGGYELSNEDAGRVFAMVTSPSGDTDDGSQLVERLREIGFEQTVTDGNAFYDDITAALARPYPEARGRLEEIEARFAGSDVNPMLRSLAPSFSRCHFLRTRAEALRRATRLTTNLHAYHQQFGRYPESLAVFAERDFAVDPFTEQGFCYRRAGRSFTLYSAGDNAQDDGGVHDPKAETNDYVLWPPPSDQ